MIIRSPGNLHYPVTITGLLVKKDQELKRDTPLFNYTYESSRNTIDEFGEEHVEKVNYSAEFRAGIDGGTLLEWKVGKGDVIARAG
jgi:RNA polymerase II subunit A C-terminal domain phosphatase